jgi:hypothetical protein
MTVNELLARMRQQHSLSRGDIETARVVAKHIQSKVWMTSNLAQLEDLISAVIVHAKLEERQAALKGISNHIDRRDKR